MLKTIKRNGYEADSIDRWCSWMDNEGVCAIASRGNTYYQKHIIPIIRTGEKDKVHLITD